jgi:hypothetical protein
MTPTAILLEVQKLHDVSARLDYFAGQHPAAEEGLLAISAHVRNSAALLEVLVKTKISPGSGLQ